MSVFKNAFLGILGITEHRVSINNPIQRYQDSDYMPKEKPGRQYKVKNIQTQLNMFTKYETVISMTSLVYDRKSTAAEVFKNTGQQHFSFNSSKHFMSTKKDNGVLIIRRRYITELD